MKNMANIAVMGYGVVGSGVVEVLEKNQESIAKRAGQSIDVKYILDLRDFPKSPYKDKFIKDFETIVNDPDIQVVAEVMGGLSPAFEFVSRCLCNGKSVVTSNKELVAAKGDVLLKIAREKNVNFLFEASVGGGIPIIRPLSQCLAANEVYEIAGILNGTTNFILTKMIQEGMPFDEALSMAQELGYAEKHPEADVEGHDACRKICILASLAFGRHVYPEQIHTEGITKITLEDVKYASIFGGNIKLIARVTRQEDGMLQIITAPMIVSKNHQLSRIDDVYNAVLVRGDAIGDVVFSGQGAGKLPTASAVVGDIIDCAKHLQSRKFLFWEEAVTPYVADYRENTVCFYVRLQSGDVKKSMEEIKKLFGDIHIVVSDSNENEIAFVTPEKVEGVLASDFGALLTNGNTILQKIRFAGL